MRSKGFFQAIVLAATVAVVASACTSGSSASPGAASGATQNVALTMWVHSDPNYMEIAKANAAEYQKETGVQVNLTFVPWDQYGAKVVAAFAAGSQPDIIQGVASWLYPQKTAGQLAEVPADFAAALADTTPASRAPVQLQGKDFGVPLNVNIDSGPFLIYNTDVFQTAGVTPEWSTWDSFVSDLQKLTVVEGGTMKRSGIEMAGADPVTQFFLYFLRAGGTFYSADQKSVQIANEHGEIALQTMYDLLHKAKVDDTNLTDYEGIASGTAASVIWGPWYTALLNTDFPDFKWGWAPIPASPGQVTEAFAGTNVWAWMVPSATKSSQAAWDYIRWMSQPDRRVAWSLKTGEIPAVESLWTDPKIASDPRWAPWFPVLKNQVPLLYIGPQDPQYKALTDMVMGVLLDTSPIPAALQTAQDQLNAIVAGQ
ncbi:MAG: extracellular solute-binding protein [Candidatus Limnocylindrales bacterium]